MCRIMSLTRSVSPKTARGPPTSDIFQNMTHPPTGTLPRPVPSHVPPHSPIPPISPSPHNPSPFPHSTSTSTPYVRSQQPPPPHYNLSHAIPCHLPLLPTLSPHSLVLSCTPLSTPPSSHNPCHSPFRHVPSHASHLVTAPLSLCTPLTPHAPFSHILRSLHCPRLSHNLPSFSPPPPHLHRTPVYNSTRGCPQSLPLTAPPSPTFPTPTPLALHFFPFPPLPHSTSLRNLSPNSPKDPHSVSPPTTPNPPFPRSPTPTPHPTPRYSSVSPLVSLAPPIMAYPCCGVIAVEPASPRSLPIPRLCLPCPLHLLHLPSTSSSPPPSLHTQLPLPPPPAPSSIPPPRGHISVDPLEYVRKLGASAVLGAVCSLKLSVSGRKKHKDDRCLHSEGLFNTAPHPDTKRYLQL